MNSPVRPPIDPALGLDRRDGLPEDLRVLIAQYPRECWMDHANLGEMARFWLSRHDMFRDLVAMIAKGNEGFQEGAIPAGEFRQWFAVRMRFLLQQLQGHHQIEDHHYFPVFANAETRLRAGFDILENDHEFIHRQLGLLANSANELISATASDDDRETDRVKRAGEAFGGDLSGFLVTLQRHLQDEEDLIVPVVLDRGEQTLFHT